MNTNNLFTTGLADLTSAIEGIANTRLIDRDRSVVLTYSAHHEGAAATGGSDTLAALQVIVHDLTDPERLSFDSFALDFHDIDRFGDNLTLAGDGVAQAVLNRGVPTQAEAREVRSSRGRVQAVATTLAIREAIRAVPALGGVRFDDDIAGADYNTFVEATTADGDRLLIAVTQSGTDEVRVTYNVADADADTLIGDTAVVPGVPTNPHPQAAAGYAVALLTSNLLGAYRADAQLTPDEAQAARDRDHNSGLAPRDSVSYGR